MNAKFLIRTAATLLAAASLAAVAMRQTQIGALRIAQQALLNDSQEAERLQLENAGLDKMREDNAMVIKLREENKDLPKLRNQVMQLRKQLGEMAKLRAENEQLANLSVPHEDKTQTIVVPGNGFGKGSLHEAGMAKPILTLQTFFSALNEGNVQRAMQCLTPEAAGKLQNGGQELLQLVNDFNGFQVIDRVQASDDEVNLQVRMNRTGVAQVVNFKLIGNEWRMNP